MLPGELAVPKAARGIVLFVHGSGSSRHSPRNRAVAEELQEANLATLLFDLLTHQEEQLDLQTEELRFDIGFLSDRVHGVRAWLAQDEQVQKLPVGYFGASTGAAAALVAAAKRPDVAAIVSRGGRPDLAGEFLTKVKAPTLLIVGGDDTEVLDLNEKALAELTCEKKLQIVSSATHLFEEPGALEQVSRLAKQWFLDKLRVQVQK
jgi:dienelactone hydrolase